LIIGCTILAIEVVVITIREDLTKDGGWKGRIGEDVCWWQEGESWMNTW